MSTNAPIQKVIDSHHHLYVRPDFHYLAQDYAADIAGSGIGASVFVQARAAYRQTGLKELRPVGETEFAASTNCAAIVAYADLTLGDKVQPVLEAHLAAGADRLKGIRHIVAWDKDARLLNPAYPTTEDLMDQPAFRAGISQLQKYDLSFDVWALFPQLGRVAQLARDFPNTHFVSNHCGGLVRINDYSKWDIFDVWKEGIFQLATLPNVSMKLSGLGMKLSGFDGDLAVAWRPWVMTCLEAFGAKRCMWGSNFPMDKNSYSLETGLNAFKQLLEQASAEEKDDVFWGTARRVYRLA